MSKSIVRPNYCSNTVACIKTTAILTTVISKGSLLPFLLIFISICSIRAQVVYQENFDTGNFPFVTSGLFSAQNGWTVARSGDDWGARVLGNGLRLTNNVDAMITNASGYVYLSESISDIASPFNSTLNNNINKCSWSFNLRNPQSNPGGFDATNYGAAFILASNGTSGYAVAIGNTGTPDPVRLIRFNGGLSPSSNQSTLISSNTTGLTDVGQKYLSIRVNYEPTTDSWELLVRDDGASFLDPSSGSLTPQGQVINTTYTSQIMTEMGFYYQGSTGNSNCEADNLKIVVCDDDLAQITAGSASICGNANTILTASGGLSYLWDNNSTDATRTVGIGTYTVTVTDVNGCVDDTAIVITQAYGDVSSGIFEAYRTIGNKTKSLEEVHNQQLGNFTEGATLLLNGGRVLTYKGLDDNICGGRIYYSIFPATGAPGAFSSLDFSFEDQYPNIGFNAGDQQWGINTTMSPPAINILQGLSPGLYKIATYVDVYGSGLNSSACDCDPLHVVDNMGQYYIEDFYVCEELTPPVISGSNTICANTTSQLSVDISGGIWVNANDTEDILLDMNGLVTGVSPGSATIRYYIEGNPDVCPLILSNDIIIDVTSEPI